MFKKQKQDTTAQTTTAPVETLPNIVVESFRPEYRDRHPELSGHGVIFVPHQPQEEMRSNQRLYDYQLTTDDGRQVVIGGTEYCDRTKTSGHLDIFIYTVETYIAEHGLSLEDIPSFVFEYADIQYKYNMGPVIGRPSFKKGILSRYKQEMHIQFAKTTTNEEREQLIAQVRGELAKFNAEFDEKSAGVQRQTKKLFDEFDSLFTEGGNDEQE